MKPLATITILLFLAEASLSAQPGGAGEWKLRVVPEIAAVRAEPTAESQALASVSRGTNLISQEKAGVWFRVVVRLAGEEIVVVGYIAESDVKVLKARKPESRNFWAVETGDFRGTGLSARVTLGGGPLAPNELSKGLRGRFKSAEAEILSGDYAVDDRKYGSLSPAYEFAVDLEYRIASRVSIAFGAGSFRAAAKDYLTYHSSDYLDRGLEATGSLKGLPLHAGFVYRMPLGRSISAYGAAGVSYYRFKFEGRQDEAQGLQEKLLGQSAKAGGAGFFGALGAELKMTSRAGFFLEAQGRYARIGGFEGTETSIHKKSISEVLTFTRQGRLYFIDDADGPRLSILESAPGAGTAREAVLDLRSLSVRGGIRLKF